MAKAFKDLPWPVLLLVASFLCPTELSVYVGSVRLPPHRALLLVLLPFVLMRLASGKVRVRSFDVALFAYATWTVVVYVVHHGPADGLQTGGSLALDGFGSFLVARAFIRDGRALRATATLIFAAVALSGAIALPETLTGRFYVHEVLGQLTGHHHPTGVEQRLGLTRAFGTFDHPIHLGTFCASGLALAIYAARRPGQVWVRSVIIPMSAVLGMSSAPLLSLAAQAALMGLEKATRGIKGRVYIGLGIVAGVFLVLSLVATRSPFAIIATGFTLDPWTGYYRLMIWEFGLGNVRENLLFGLGLNDWARPDWMVSSTVDAFWLVIAMRGGLPAVVLLIAGVLLLGRGVGLYMRRTTGEARLLATGWIISLAALSLVGCTVHFWNVPYAFFFFFLGLGGAIADPLRRRSGAPAARGAATAPAARVTWVAPGQMPTPIGAGAGPGPLPAWASASPRWPVPVVGGSARGRNRRG